MVSKKVKLEVSDPWDFGTVHGVGPFEGKIIKTFSSDAYNECVLAVLKLDKPLCYKTICYEFLLVQPRHKNSMITEIADGNDLFCNLYVLSEEAAYSVNPLVAMKDDVYVHAPVLIGAIHI